VFSSSPSPKTPSPMRKKNSPGLPLQQNAPHTNRPPPPHTHTHSHTPPHPPTSLTRYQAWVTAHTAAMCLCSTFGKCPCQNIWLFMGSRLGHPPTHPLPPCLSQYKTGGDQGRDQAVRAAQQHVPLQRSQRCRRRPRALSLRGKL